MAIKMEPTKGTKFLHDLCKALGLEGRPVVSVTVNADADALMTMTLTEFVPKDRSEAVAAVLAAGAGDGELLSVVEKKTETLPVQPVCFDTTTVWNEVVRTRTPNPDYKG